MKCSCPSFVPDRSKQKNLRMEFPHVLVPCGKCPNCLAARASAWSFRLMQEEKVSKSAYFITLTYDSDHIPITRNEYLTIRYNDLQLMMKRIRRAHEYLGYENKIKYYAVGEYGGKLKRPHYHIILFNASVNVLFEKGQRIILKAFGMDGKTCVRMKQWDKGHVTIGSVTEASVGYTLKYISKPGSNFRENDDRERPFSVMSKKLGIDYLNEKMLKWHLSDLKGRMYCNLKDGKKCSMPRYYKDKIYSEAERAIIKKQFADEFAEKIFHDILMLSDEDYARKERERIAAREAAIVKIQKIKNSDYAKNQKSIVCRS